MKDLKILVVEDELIIAESLKATLQGMGYDVVDIFTSGTEVAQKYVPGMADIAFMDIFLANNTDGITAAVQLIKKDPIPVIFLTNSTDEFLRKKAIFDTNAVYYLTKPFTKVDISTAIDFALKQLKAYQFADTTSNEPGYLLENSIFLKNGLGHKKVMIDDITMLEADGSYCKFTFKDGRQQVFSENLSYFGDKLSFAKELLRIHRSYIVNVNFIERVHESRVWIKGNEIPISRNYKSNFMEKFRFV
jgi:DNA-binding LytR/AlgR family response regulator